MAQTAGQNVSAGAYAWLKLQLGMDLDEGSAPVVAGWSEIRAAMHRYARNGQRIVQSVDWVSDYWIARGASPVSVVAGPAPVWMPPDALDAWPGLDAQAAVEPIVPLVKRSNHEAFLDVLAKAAVPYDTQHSAAEALDQFLEKKASLIPGVFDNNAIQVEHVRAWLGTSLGHLLMSAALEPANDPTPLTQAVVARLAIPEQVGVQQGIVDELGDRHLEVLYNARMRTDGTLVLGKVRTGQGEEWRDHWLAVDLELAAEKTREAVQMAARLMCCRPLVMGLTEAIGSPGQMSAKLAVGVLRRWLLTLKSMAWLEDALRRTWRDVRTRDLCSFALNATKPEWPRRTLALSHRSQDVKPRLHAMPLWHSTRVAIDATYVPSWETNVGMVWGLFAATPVIVRVASPKYDDSIWCRRERELTDYLLEKGDYLDERMIADLDVSDIGKLDSVMASWRRDDALDGAFAKVAEFPPLSEICSPPPTEEWEAVMYRAGAALRLIHAIIPGSTPAFVNELAEHLQHGGDMPPEGPTNNPDTWESYRDAFREIATYDEPGGTRLAVMLPDDYGASEQMADRQMAQRIPDLRTGTPSLRDVLVAMEWLRVEWPLYLERNRGDLLAINCQRLDREGWENGETVSLHRGLAAMRDRLPVPLWTLQTAGQDIDEWPLLGRAPIFTEHVSAQFAWMLEAYFDRETSRQAYAERCGLILSPALARRCRGEG